MVGILAIGHRSLEMIPMELVNTRVRHRAIQTMSMDNKHKGSKRMLTKHNNLPMSPPRLCSEDKGKEVLDDLHSSALQLVRVQLKKRIASLLFIVTLASALPVSLFSS